MYLPLVFLAVALYAAYTIRPAQSAQARVARTLVLGFALVGGVVCFGYGIGKDLARADAAVAGAPVR